MRLEKIPSSLQYRGRWTWKNSDLSFYIEAVGLRKSPCSIEFHPEAYLLSGGLGFAERDRYNSGRRRWTGAIL